MAKKTNADIGFEKQIWDAACVLRGNMDASEYKNVVLGLIFLKYISDRFDEKHKALVEEGDGFEEDIDEYTSEVFSLCPPVHAGARSQPKRIRRRSAQLSMMLCARLKKKINA